MPTEIKTAFDPDDVEWEMTWDSKQFPGKPPIEIIFEPAKALALLLLNEVCFVNSFYYEETWPDRAKEATNVFVNCNDTFAYACADAEDLPYKQIKPLYEMWKKNPVWGPVAWAVMQRKERPIEPVVRGLVESGYDIEELLAKPL